MSFTDSLIISAVTLASCATLAGFFTGLALTMCALVRLCQKRPLPCAMRSLLVGWSFFLTGWWFLLRHEPSASPGISLPRMLSATGLCLIVAGSLWFFLTWRTFRQEVKSSKL